MCSHPLDCSSSAADNAQSAAAYLTSSEASREPSFSGQPPSSDPSFSGQPPSSDYSFRGQPPSSDHSFRGQPPSSDPSFRGQPPSSDPSFSAQDLPKDQAVGPSRSLLTEKSPGLAVSKSQQLQMEQHHQQQLQAPEPLPQLWPPMTDSYVQEHVQTEARSVGSAGRDYQPVGAAVSTTTTPRGHPTLLADPLLGSSPGRAEYDPQRYKPRTPHEADLENGLSSPLTQGLIPQTHLLGESPRQAAILKLRTLSVKLSQGIKAGAMGRNTQAPTDTTTAPVSNPSTAPASDLVAPSDSQSPDAAEEQLPSADSTAAATAAGATRRSASGHLAQQEPAQTQAQTPSGVMQSSSVHTGEGTAPVGQLSPRRSISMAKLRSQSLAKHLQEHRYTPQNRLSAVPDSTTVAVMPQLDGSGAHTQAAAQGLVPAEAAAGFMQSSSVHTGEGTVLVGLAATQAKVRTQHPSAGALSLPAAQVQSDQAAQRPKAPLDTADIDIVLLSEHGGKCLSPRPCHEGQLTLARSAEGLLPSNSLSSEGMSATMPVVERRQSRSEGCSPVSMGSSSKTSDRHGSDPHHGRGHASASSASVAGPGRQGSTLTHDHSMSDSRVALCISSSDAGATISLEVVTQHSSIPTAMMSSEEEHQQATGQSGPDQAHPAATAPLTDAIKLSADAHGRSEELNHMACSPVTSAMTRQHACGTEEDAGEAAMWTQPAAPSSASQQLQQQNPSSEEDEEAAGHQQGDESGMSTQDRAIRRSNREAKPSAGAPHSLGAVPTSPSKKKSPGQSLLWRLEGGIRTLLGRTPKQVGGRHSTNANVQDSTANATNAHLPSACCH